MTLVDYVQPIYSFVERGEGLILDATKEATKTSPIFVGNGFFVGDYFITAAHIIAENEGINGQSNPFIIWNDKRIVLSRKNTMIWNMLPTDKDGNRYGYEDKSLGDVSVFKVDGVNSPFKLSECVPKEGQILRSDFYHKLPQKPDNGSVVHPIKCNGINIYLWETTAKVRGIEDQCGNFFSTTMNPPHPIGGGSSGSPLYEGNTIYGILHGGGASILPEICVFYSSSHLLSLMQNLQ